MNQEDDSREKDPALREKLRELLADGLETDWQDRAGTTEEGEEVVSRLQLLSPDDHEQKLIIAGFLDRPYTDEDTEMPVKCDTCVRFLSHEKHCDVPELDLPVEPEWSCVLWRA